MSNRIAIALIVLAPLALLGALFALGRAVPVPVLGRDYVLRIDFPPDAGSANLPGIAGPSNVASPLIVIDPGHGGFDPGASGGGYMEKTVVLGLAKALRDELVRQGGVRVAMTRDFDTFLVVEERYRIARELGADLFLSIHADSAGEKEGVTGASIYVLSEKASSQAAARFAARENDADMVNGVDMAGQDRAVEAILVDLSQRRTSAGSEEFARLIEREGKGVITFHEQPQRSAALRVLRAPDMPSVLFEAGFISNEDEARALASPEGQKRFAQAMARAVKVWFLRNPKTSPGV